MKQVKYILLKYKCIPSSRYTFLCKLLFETFRNPDERQQDRRLDTGFSVLSLSFTTTCVFFSTGIVKMFILSYFEKLLNAFPLLMFSE